MGEANEKNLKIKLSIGSFNIELDGPSEVVISQFEDLKKNGLGGIVDQLVPLVTSTQKIDAVPLSETANKVQDPLLLGEENPLPVPATSLQNLVFKQLPSSEREWILVYAYFLNAEGRNTFKRSDIIQKYEESNRKTEQRIKNLSQSIIGAVGKNWISALNDTDFIITDQGKQYVSQIMSRKEGFAKTFKKRPKKEENKQTSSIEHEQVA